MPSVSAQGGVIAVGYMLGLDSPDPEVDRITLLGQNPAPCARLFRSVYPRAFTFVSIWMLKDQNTDGL